MKLARQFDDPAEGDRLLIEVVKNAGNLGRDSMRKFGDEPLCGEYRPIDVLNVVSFDIESFQL